MTASRIFAALVCFLPIAACGNVSPKPADAGASTGSSTGASTSSSTATQSSIVGCPGSTLDASACPAFQTCVSASVTGSCKSSYDACYGSAGPCGAYLACTAPCSCSDSTCVSGCSSTMTSACSSCVQTANMCSENQCSTPLAQCLVGMPDAATHNCTDLAKCCGSLPPSEVMGCLDAVSLNSDTVCSTFFGASGCP